LTRFVFWARGVAHLMLERAENGAATPRWLTVGGRDTEVTSEPVLRVVRLLSDIAAANRLLP